MTERYDRLLDFLSEKGSGEWKDLKEAFDWIWGPTNDPAERAWIAARDLAALGHIEVAWGERIRWCAAPPLLTMLPRSGGRAFVTGARTRFLRRRLDEATEERQLWIDECGSQRGPTTLLVACSSAEEAKSLANNDLKIDYTYSVSEQLSALLPGLDRYMALFEPGELPAGFEPERFNAGRIGSALKNEELWDREPEMAERGLFRTRTFHGQSYALLDAASRWHRVVPEFATYEVLRWENQNVLEYDERSAMLRVPTGAPLPALHARAASLCDGRLPRLERRSANGGGPAKAKSSKKPGKKKAERTRCPVLVYDNVPRKVAERIAASLSQDLGDGGSDA